MTSLNSNAPSPGSRSQSIPMSGKLTGWPIPFLLSVALIVLVLLNLGLGAVTVPLPDIAAVLIGKGDPDYRAILLDYRLARVLVGILVGAGLAVAGTIVQTLLRNPLASPSTLGISAGAGLGAVIVTLLLPVTLPGMLSTAAFAGGAAVALSIYIIAYRYGIDPIRLTLVGVAIGTFCGAGIDLLLLKGSANLATTLIWLNGSFWGRNWHEFWELLPWIAILLPVAWRLSLQLDLFHLGETVAQGLGMRVAAIRLLLFCTVIGLAGASAAAAGTVSFIGLICPHMTRALVGTRHRIVLPTAALLGSLIAIGADLISRILHPPLEIPAGLIISAVGAPYFIYLLWRSSRRMK